MLATIWLSLALFDTAQADIMGLLRCSGSEKDPMTKLQLFWPAFMVFERRLKHGDWVRLSFAFRREVSIDSALDFRKYDRRLSLDENIVTLHMRFIEKENRLSINAHDTPGVWQNNEQSIPWRENWKRGSLLKIEIRYRNSMFEIYEMTSMGTLLISKFLNRHRDTELITATGDFFYITEAQLICYGNDPDVGR
ncbi:unnamed protein product [Caenorhabditis auriculariae]|uniref:Galectin n=1 Tax=Caenorhabditis auriculariae TaxID=2777116 RepID=A0A8S1GTL8_9PELO|nr:unnamed protein product [Caenorhabditis auriculariae]